MDYPLKASPMVGTLADVVKTKKQLLTENALVHLHINPYRKFWLNLEERLPIESGEASTANGEKEVG